MSDIADKRRVIAEEIFAWAEMIIVLLDRMIVALRVQDLGNEQRRELSLRARQIERLFVEIQEIVEIHDEADLDLEELIVYLHRLTELITSTHEIIDHLIESQP